MKRTPRFERLDARITLDAAAGAAIPWLEPQSLTYSFVPDGTALASEQSTLYSELAATGAEQQWQQQFDRALAAWLEPMGFTAVQVADAGTPFGSSGPTQGDLRFGDIRIGAVPMVGNVIAEAVPHSILTQGSWAGDILLNSNADWTELQQVFSVALHEFGHVLGLGHSQDPSSPMFFHGVYDAVAPTDVDLAELLELYAGVHVDGDSDDDLDDDGVGQPGDDDDDWREEPHFDFDVTQAIPLTAVLATSARYSASGSLTVDRTSVLYKLETIGKIDDAEYLNIVVSSGEQDGLIPNVTVYDSVGTRVNTRVLRNSSGVLAIQARDVKPDHSYFLAVTPAATASRYQLGSFEFLAEFSEQQLKPTEIADYELTVERPVVEQRFHVSTSRLVQLLVATESESVPSGTTSIWGTLVDESGDVIAQVAMNPGDTRSASLVFLDPAEYKLIIQTGTSDGSDPAAVKVNIFIDEISIDVGPGVVDPTIEPILSCDSIGADLTTCKPTTPIVLVDGPIFPDPNSLPPTPTYPSLPPWTSPSWHFWAPVSESTVSPYRHNLGNPPDVSGDAWVTPLDVLLIVNELNNSSVGRIDRVNFLDASGDGFLSAIDALLVVNALNANGLSGAGESTAVPQVLSSGIATDLVFSASDVAGLATVQTRNLAASRT